MDWHTAFAEKYKDPRVFSVLAAKSVRNEAGYPSPNALRIVSNARLLATLRDLSTSEEDKQRAMEQATEDERIYVLSAFPSFVTLLHGDQLVSALCDVPACADLVPKAQAMPLIGETSDGTGVLLDKASPLSTNLYFHGIVGSGAALGRIFAKYGSTGSVDWLLDVARDSDEGARALQTVLEERVRGLQSSSAEHYARMLSSLHERVKGVRRGILRALLSNKSET